MRGTNAAQSAGATLGATRGRCFPDAMAARWLHTRRAARFARLRRRRAVGRTECGTVGPVLMRAALHPAHHRWLRCSFNGTLPVRRRLARVDRAQHRPGATRAGALVAATRVPLLADCRGAREWRPTGSAACFGAASSGTIRRFIFSRGSSTSGLWRHPPPLPSRAPSPPC
jgi:hypothetical protein